MSNIEQKTISQAKDFWTDFKAGIIDSPGRNYCEIKNCIIDFKIDFNNAVIASLGVQLGCFELDDNGRTQINCDLSWVNVTFNDSMSFVAECTQKDHNCSNVSFNGCIFEKEFSVCQSKFNSNIEFKNCQFKEKLQFEKSEFLGSVNFNEKNLFFDDIIVYDCVFVRDVTFDSLGTYRQRIWFEMSKINSIISFQSKVINSLQFNMCVFSIDSSVRITGVNCSGEIRFVDSAIEGVIALQDINIETLSFLDTIITGNLLESKLKIKTIPDRYTACLLKHQSIKRNNFIDALSYKSKELSLYKKELKDRKHSAEIILLWLNTASNNNGLSWLRGVGFTIFVAILFFWAINYVGINNARIFVIDWRFERFGDVWGQFLEMFNLINYREKFEPLTLNEWGATLVMLSKIFIGYGIYQTISAFRKFGK